MGACFYSVVQIACSALMQIKQKWIEKWAPPLAKKEIKEALFYSVVALRFYAEAVFNQAT